MTYRAANRRLISLLCDKSGLLQQEVSGGAAGCVIIQTVKIMWTWCRWARNIFLASYHHPAICSLQVHRGSIFPFDSTSTLRSFRALSKMVLAVILPRLQSVPTNETSSNAFTATVVPPTTNGAESIAVNVLMFLFTTLWTGLRFRARRSKGQSYLTEDFLCAVALVSPLERRG